MIRNFEHYDTRFTISKILATINRMLWQIPTPYGFGFCLHCFRFTTHIHDDSDTSYHCEKCCRIMYGDEFLRGL